MNPAILRLLVITGVVTASTSAVPLKSKKWPSSIHPKDHSDSRNGKAKHLTPSFNPALGSHMEGDIVLSHKKSRWPRNAVIDHNSRWENATVPYEMSDVLNPDQKKKLSDAFEQFHKHTCVQFVPRTTQADYIHIHSNDTNCSADVGRNRGMQIVNLGATCFERATIIHELMHALGFWHEQSRPDRDFFINIRDENIEASELHNFFRKDDTETLNVPYDFESVMHYQPNSFSKYPPQNGQPAIEAKPEFRCKTSVMGQRNYFSVSDVRKINKMYCGDSPDPDPSDPKLYPLQQT